jgi:hypothetical protein
MRWQICSHIIVLTSSLNGSYVDLKWHQHLHDHKMTLLLNAFY